MSDQRRPAEQIFTDRIQRVQRKLIHATSTQGLTMTEDEREAFRVKLRVIADDAVDRIHVEPRLFEWGDLEEDVEFADADAWSDAVARGRQVEISAIADELDAQLADLKDGDPGGLTPGVKWCRARVEQMSCPALPPAAVLREARDSLVEAYDKSLSPEEKA